MTVTFDWNCTYPVNNPTPKQAADADLECRFAPEQGQVNWHCANCKWKEDKHGLTQVEEKGVFRNFVQSMVQDYQSG